MGLWKPNWHFKGLCENSMKRSRKELEFYSGPPAAMLRFHTTMQTCPKSARKGVLSSTAALHIQRGRLTLLLLSHMPWSQYEILLGETWNEAKTVFKPNPSQSPQSSGITWEPQAALITKYITFWEGDWCQCCLYCSFVRGTCRCNTPQTICLQCCKSSKLFTLTTKMYKNIIRYIDNTLISPSPKLPGVLWMLFSAIE